MRLYRTDCDDNGKQTIKLMKPTEQNLQRTELILTLFAENLPSVAADAQEARDLIRNILNTCAGNDGTDLIDEQDIDEEDDLVFEPIERVEATAGTV